MKKLSLNEKTSLTISSKENDLGTDFTVTVLIHLDRVSCPETISRTLMYDVECDEYENNFNEMISDIKRETATFLRSQGEDVSDYDLEKEELCLRFAIDFPD